MIRGKVECTPTMTDVQQAVVSLMGDERDLAASLPKSIRTASPNCKVDLIEVFDLLSIVFCGLEDELSEMIAGDALPTDDELQKVRDRAGTGADLCERVIAAIRESMGTT